jgi:hypothetical protein
VTKARDQNNKYDKFALATYGKKEIEKRFKKILYNCAMPFLVWHFLLLGAG